MKLVFTKWVVEKLLACDGPWGKDNADSLAKDWLILEEEVREAVANADKFATERDAAIRRTVEVLEALKEVVGCFEAAEAEGLYEALIEEAGTKMETLYSRRLRFAYDAATKVILPPEAGKKI